MILSDRLQFIDLAKGIGMVLIVFNHVATNFSNNLFSETNVCRMVLSFYIPLFFFLSGLFFSVKNDFLSFLKIKINRLLIPFLFFYIITFLITAILYLLGMEVKNDFSWTNILIVFHQDVFSNNAIWFLLALFWMNLFYYPISKIKKGYIKIFCITFLALIGYTIREGSKYSINIPLYIDTAMTACPFLYFGDLFRKCEGLNIRMNKFVLLFMCILMLLIDYLLGQSMSMVSNVVPNFFLLYIAGMGGSLCVLFLSKLINKMPLISFIGENSLMVLCTHLIILTPIFKLITHFNLNFWISAFLILNIILLSYYAIVPFLNKVIPWFVGRKNLIE
jgi:fucose 4-O-acetylase-like acetyltransferase